MTINVNNFLSWLPVRDVYLNDSGTWRRCREIYVNDSGTWRRVHYNGIIDGILTAGTAGSTSGYTAGSFGSLSQATTDDGRTITSITYTNIDINTQFFRVTVNGFTSDPGISWLGTLTITGHSTWNGGSATSYTFGGGQSEWRWDFTGQAFTNGQPYTFNLIRN